MRRGRSRALPNTLLLNAQWACRASERTARPAPRVRHRAVTEARARTASAGPAPSSRPRTLPAPRGSQRLCLVRKVGGVPRSLAMAHSAEQSRHRQARPHEPRRQNRAGSTLDLPLEDFPCMTANKAFSFAMKAERQVAMSGEPGYWCSVATVLRTRIENEVSENSLRRMVSRFGGSRIGERAIQSPSELRVAGSYLEQTS